jgi:hypothetical protein
MMLKNFLFNRPKWFTHEGYWRLAQVIRLGPFYGLLVTSGVLFIAAIFQENNFDTLLGGAFAAGGAVVLLGSAHLLLKLIVWIADGFQATRKTS